MSRYGDKVLLYRNFVQNRNGFLQICLSISITSVSPFKRIIGVPNRDLRSKCVFRNMTYCGKSGKKKKKKVYYILFCVFNIYFFFCILVIFLLFLLVWGVGVCGVCCGVWCVFWCF